MNKYQANKYQVLDYIIECDYDLSEYLPEYSSEYFSGANKYANFQLFGENIHELLCINLPQALADQGEVVLHASSYVENEKLIAFAGLSGAGKSTRALSVLTSAQIAGDEALVLRLENNKVIGLTYAHPLRIWNDGLKDVATHTKNTCAELARLNLLVHHPKATRAPERAICFEDFLQNVYSPSASNTVINQTLALKTLSIYQQLVHQKLIETLSYNH